MDLQWLLARRIPLLAGLAALVLLVWYLCYFHAMAPKKGTLEWISFAGLPPLSRPNICPIRGVCWIALPAALLLGAADCLLRMDAVYLPASLVFAVVPAVAALIFCLLLLFLHGRLLTALCGTALLLACGSPDAALSLALTAALLLMLSGMARHPAARILLLLGALLSAAAALWAFGTLRLDAASRFAPSMRLRIALPDRWNLPALLAVSAVPVELVQAARLRRGRSLYGALLGILCLPFLFLGLPQLAYAGCIAALCGTFAAAETRGAWPVLPAAALFFCILCSL